MVLAHPARDAPEAFDPGRREYEGQTQPEGVCRGESDRATGARVRGRGREGHDGGERWAGAGRPAETEYCPDQWCTEEPGLRAPAWRELALRARACTNTEENEPHEDDKNSPAPHEQFTVHSQGTADGGDENRPEDEDCREPEDEEHGTQDHPAA